jgi:putative membrane protein
MHNSGEDEGADQRGWLARATFPDGEEPDPRFTLANERTFLAWTRTSLAFLAAGVALEAFDIESLNPHLQSWIAVAMLVVGILIAAGAALRWLNVERAMRRGKALPVPGIVPLLGLAGVFAALMVLVGVAL